MKVNKAIYVIVALFLGGLGIHKFYADKFGQGLFHLLFFWTGIPTIISIIHAIIVIFTRRIVILSATPIKIHKKCP